MQNQMPALQPIPAVLFDRSTRAAGPSMSLVPELFCGLDWLDLRLSSVYAGHGVSRGHGEAVVLVPGFLADDSSLRELHGWLNRIGYRAYYSGIGAHTRCGDELLGHLLETVARARAETRGRVTIVGHSLGGLLARRAALTLPQLVSAVVTFGSPVTGINAHPWVMAIAEALRGECDGACIAASQAPLPAGIRQGCLYTKTDGVVDWRTCLSRDADYNIEVAGTHVGLVCNREAYQALATLLAEFARRPSLALNRTESPRLAAPSRTDPARETETAA